MSKYSRRSFLQAAGLATGAAAISASPALAAAADPGAIDVTPSSSVPHEPVIAIVRDASLGEVTVLSGQTEKTYKDWVLVRRILKASQQNHKAGHGTGRVA